MDSSRPHRLITALPVLLLTLLVLGACSSAGDSDATSADDSSAEVPAAAAEHEPAARSAAEEAEDVPADSLSAFESGAGADAASPESERSIISKGVVSVLDKDVAEARFDVQKIVDVHDGEVAEEETETDDDGAVSRSRLVVRVPVRDFDAAMEELENVGELESSSRNSEDVTTAVIDNEARIRAKSESLERVEVLLGRAQSIRDIVSIEAELTRRQADLDSLKGRQAYLADQTSMSTITVFLELAPEPAEKKKVEKEETATGFLAGLSSGWGALKSFMHGAATVVGALLPFALMVLLLGVPAWLLLRSLARRRPPATVTAASE